MTNKKILNLVYSKLRKCMKNNSNFRTIVGETVGIIEKERKKQKGWENEKFSSSWYSNGIVDGAIN